MLKPLITLQSVSLVPQFLLPFWNCRDLKHHRNMVQRNSSQPGQEQPSASPLEAPCGGRSEHKAAEGEDVRGGKRSREPLEVEMARA